MSLPASSFHWLFSRAWISHWIFSSLFLPLFLHFLHLLTDQVCSKNDFFLSHFFSNPHFLTHTHGVDRQLFLYRPFRISFLIDLILFALLIRRITTTSVLLSRAEKRKEVWTFRARRNQPSLPPSLLLIVVGVISRRPPSGFCSLAHTLRSFYNQVGAMADPWRVVCSRTTVKIDATATYQHQ